ncbi:MAG: hypothetical protein ABIF17_05105 [Patescibacteria group bacterium]
MNYKLKIFIIFAIIIILSFILSPYTGSLYENIIGHGVSSGWIGGCPECYEGFMMSFAFLSGLLFFGLLNTKRLQITLPFVLFFPILALIAGDGNAFLVDLAAGIIGFVLGQLIYLVKKKIKK